MQDKFEKGLYKIENLCYNISRNKDITNTAQFLCQIRIYCMGPIVLNFVESVDFSKRYDTMCLTE